MKIMKTIILFLILSLPCTTTIYSQQDTEGSKICSDSKSSSTTKHTEGFNYYDSQNSPVHSYDVLQYKINLDIYSCFISPYSKAFKASNEINLRVDSVLNSIKLNAVNTSLVIDSVKLNVLSLTFTHSSNILTLNLDRTYNPGEIITLKIYYRNKGNDSKI